MESSIFFCLFRVLFQCAKSGRVFLSFLTVALGFPAPLPHLQELQAIKLCGASEAVNQIASKAKLPNESFPFDAGSVSI